MTVCTGCNARQRSDGPPSKRCVACSMGGLMELNQDFYEFFASLAKHDVRFLVVGGYAMAAHGQPRFTKDLDVWIWMDPDNSAACVAALEEFGFGSLGLTPADFGQPDSVVQLGYPPSRIDLLTTPDGVTFEECWPNRLVIEVGALKIPVLGLRGLIDNKAAAARPQDLADAAVLRRLLQRLESPTSPEA